LEAFINSADEAGYYPASLAQLDTLYIEDKPREVQDRFNYFLGRFFGNVIGNYPRGVELLGRVGSDSTLKPKALYAQAVMQANPALGENVAAVQNFQNAILAAEDAPGAADASDIRELAYLALARVAYEAANYDGALYYYNKVDRFSTRYPRALFEQAWTYFLKGDTRNALGTFHSVSSPYYDGYYFPDLWVMEATVYLNLCRYDLAKEALATFKKEYLVKLPLLTQFLVSQSNPTEYYDKVVQMIDNRDSGST